jgi:hypothetical protein
MVNENYRVDLMTPGVARLGEAAAHDQGLRALLNQVNANAVHKEGAMFHLVHHCP